jgi:hypothetical protein
MRGTALLLTLLAAAQSPAVDVTVTPASVARVSGAGTGVDTVITNGFAGAAIVAGQSVYRDANGVWLLTDANLSAAAGVARGIALNSAPAAGQPVAVATGGTMNPGFTATVGKIYVASATAGGIAPVEDLASGWRTGVLCVGLTSTSVGLVLYSSGVAVP